MMKKTSQEKTTQSQIRNFKSQARENLVQEAKKRGFDLRERTLRYWEWQGLFPKPKFLIYPEELINKVCLLCELKGQSFPKKQSEMNSIQELSYAPDYGLIKVIEIIKTLQTNGHLRSYKKLKDGSIIVNIKRGGDNELAQRTTRKEG
jgi:hypothetical protein